MPKNLIIMLIHDYFMHLLLQTYNQLIRLCIRCCISYVLIRPSFQKYEIKLTHTSFNVVTCLFRQITIINQYCRKLTIIYFQIKDISAHLILDFIDTHFASDTFGISVLLSQLFCCPEDLFE